MRALVAFAIAALASTSLAHAATSSADVHELAKAVVAIGEEPAFGAKTMEPIEALLARGISLELSIMEPAATAKVKGAVHQALAPISDRAGDVQIDAYAANFSAQELSDILAYLNTPAAKAEKANLPLLKAEMRAALSGGSNRATIVADAMKAYDDAPPAKRELILRILKAQDFEARNTRDLATLAALKATLPPIAGREKTQTPSSAQAVEDAQAADDDMRLMVAIQKRYYVDHFSEADLSTAASYLESEAGQAVLTRLPAARRTMAKAMADVILAAVGSLDEKVCASVPCTADQRATIAEQTKSMASMMTSVVGAMTK